MVAVERDGKKSPPGTPQTILAAIRITDHLPKRAGDRCDIYTIAASTRPPPPSALTGAVTGGEIKGEKVLAIYRLDGDKLTLCCDYGGKDHPAAFQAAAGDGRVVYHLEGQEVAAAQREFYFRIGRSTSDPHSIAKLGAPSISRGLPMTTARKHRTMNPTYKTRRDGTKKAAFAAYFTLTPQQVAKVGAMAAADGMSGRRSGSGRSRSMQSWPELASVPFCCVSTHYVRLCVWEQSPPGYELR